MAGFRRFNKSDLSLIDSTGIRQEALEQWQKEKYSFTLWDRNRVIAICGVVTMHEGVGEIWLILEDDKNGDRFKIARNLKKLTDAVFKESSFHRFQSRAPVDEKVSNRFLAFLGFKKEGVLEQYGLNREDYFVYARIKSWHK